MANNLIPEELQALIDQYLTDGVLTDKERQVILKKAVGMGLDRDEIDLYLDAEVQKIDQATDAAVRKQRNKECPYCGAPVPQLADKCPECGQFITPEAGKDLQDILENLEEALVNMKSRKDFERNKATVERYARKAKLYYSNHPKIKALLAEVEAEMKLAENKVKSEARRSAVISTINNRWFWVFVECVLSAIIIIYLSMQYSKSEQVFQDIKVKWVESNYDRDSEVYVKFVGALDSKEDLYNQRAWVILASIIIIPSTAVYAARAKRKKE